LEVEVVGMSRDRVVMLRLGESEEKLLRLSAELAGVAVSTWIRLACLERAISEAVDRGEGGDGEG
jgi:uncharacterized protein (DUF1778 family)